MNQKKIQEMRTSGVGEGLDALIAWEAHFNEAGEGGGVVVVFLGVGIGPEGGGLFEFRMVIEIHRGDLGILGIVGFRGAQ